MKKILLTLLLLAPVIAMSQQIIWEQIETISDQVSVGVPVYDDLLLIQDVSDNDFRKSVRVDSLGRLVNSLPHTYVQYDTTYTPTGLEPTGVSYWDDDNRTVSVALGNGVVMQVNQESLTKIYNNTGDTLKNGVIVGFDTIMNASISVQKASNTGRHQFLGVTTEDILNGEYGMVVSVIGRVNNINTGSLTIGAIYLDSLGLLTNTPPQFPKYSYPLGFVLKTGITDGVIQFRSDGINYKNSIVDAFDGSIRESFDFRIISDGTTVLGIVNNSSMGDHMTLVRSANWYDYNVPDTITLVPGLIDNPQIQYVYIDSARVLQVSTSGYPTNEHSKVATVVLADAASTQTYGALRNQNINDHFKSELDNGHIMHIGERIRAFNAEWESGTAASISGTPPNLYISVTEGKVWQMHLQTFPDQSMATGDDMHVVNDPVSPYRTTTNLNTVTTYSDGSTWNNSWANLVIWGVCNKSGEVSHIMCNLSSDGYTSEGDAFEDANNYANYTIPRIFRGVGFLIARFTIRRSPAGYTYNPTTGYLDLRGYIPNNTAGGGTGSSGITDYIQLDDTPASITALAFQRGSALGGTLENVLAGSVLLTEFDSTGFTVDTSQVVGLDVFRSDIQTNTDSIIVIDTDISDHISDLANPHVTGLSNLSDYETTDMVHLYGGVELADNVIFGVQGGNTLFIGKTLGSGTAAVRTNADFTFEKGIIVNNNLGLTFGAESGSNSLNANTAETFLFDKIGGGLANYEFTDNIANVLFDNNNTTTFTNNVTLNGTPISDNHAARIVDINNAITQSYTQTLINDLDYFQDTLTITQGTTEHKVNIQANVVDPSLLSTPSMVVLGKTSNVNQNIGGANGTETWWTWDVETYRDNIYNLDSSEVTVASSGWYKISFIGAGMQTGVGRTTLQGIYRINGEATNRTGTMRNYTRGSVYGNTSPSLMATVYLEANDVIEVGSRVEDTDGTYTINTSGSEIDDNEHQLVITRLAIGSPTEIDPFWTADKGSYYTKTETDLFNVSKWINDAGYLTIVDTTDIVSANWEIYINGLVDLSNYYTKTESDGKYLQTLPSNLAYTNTNNSFSANQTIEPSGNAYLRLKDSNYSRYLNIQYTGSSSLVSFLNYDGATTTILSLDEYGLYIPKGNVGSGNFIPSNMGGVYGKGDGKLYYKQNGGTEYDLTAGTGGGSGTVTSVAISSTDIDVTGTNPITGSGTFNLALADNSVGAAEIATGAVGSSELASSSVNSSELNRDVISGLSLNTTIASDDILMRSYYFGGVNTLTKITMGNLQDYMQDNLTFSGGSVNFGSATQLPFMNAGATDFSYSSNLVWSGSALGVGGAIVSTGFTQSAGGFGVDIATYIDKDGSGNITFTDAVTGTKTLAELSDSGSGSGRVVTTNPTITNNDYTIILNDNAITEMYMPSSSSNGQVFQVINRTTNAVKFRNSTDTSDINYKASAGGDNSVAVVGHATIIQYISGTWYQTNNF